MPFETVAKSTDPPACDCHFHVFNARENAAGARYIPNYAALLADWQAQSSPLNILRGVVVQPSFLGADNSLLLTTLAHRPHQLRGVAVITESATYAELKHLYLCGVRGIRLNLIGAADDVQAIRELPATWWSALIAAGLHLELHSDVGRIAVLLPLVPQDVIVVLDHFAKPLAALHADETVRAVCARQKAGTETYITLSGSYRLSRCDTASSKKFSKDLAALWVTVVGPHHLLWGSDWPCTNYESEANYLRLRDALDQWLPDAEERLAALHTNPARLYWR